jgi:hypothetical protein
MTTFASTPRTTRRPRRISSVASLVRALGTVRITDQPVDRPASSGSSAVRRPRDLGSRTRAGRRPRAHRGTAETS